MSVDEAKLRANIVRALDFLCETSLQIATEHGFTEATPGEDIALIHSEASEALEDIRAGKAISELTFEGEKRKPCGVPSELADIVIRVCHFAEKHRVDLAEAVVQKTLYNDTRPFKHGGKVL